MANQKEYLDAMGIEVWRLRHTESDIEKSDVSDDTALETAVKGDVAKSNAGTNASINDLDLPSLEQHVAQCQKCSLHQSRTQTVFGVGNPDADWMFVGEAPGGEEDRQGIPFVGRAGQLLTAILSALGLERDVVYIANVLKCRPPGNRDPDGEEVMRCEPYLYRQVELVNPKIIIAMGRFGAQSLLKTHESVGKLRGKKYSYSDTGIPLVVTYHPAYLLRSPGEKRKSWSDLLLARSIVSETANG